MAKSNIDNKNELKKAEEMASAESSKIIEELIEKETITEAIKLTSKDSGKTAKAGKRSAKSIKEAKEKESKELKKHSSIPQEKIQIQKKPTRSLIERKGKNYKSSIKMIDKTRSYSILEASELAIKTSKTKFDSTVEIHVRLGVDPRQADQNIRSTVILPSGTGKELKIAVISSKDDLIKKANESGADIAGYEEVLQNLEKDKIEFDVLIASPEIMPKLGKYARLLGPKGLMPSPKSGTVTNDIEKAVNEAKMGKIEYRVDSNGIVHAGVGKTSFGAEKIAVNVKAVIESIKTNRPSSLKNSYITSIFLTSTMGPSIQINSSEV